MYENGEYNRVFFSSDESSGPEVTALPAYEQTI